MARVFVLTVSDRSARGERPDETGPLLAERLRQLGHEPETAIVADEPAAIAGAVRSAAGTHRVIVVAGGTGIGPRDVSPQAVSPLLDYEIPGLGEVMRARGRDTTPYAALSRSLGGVLGGCLVLVVPGSPRGALESLDAVSAVLGHALDTLAGSDHGAASSRGAEPAR